MAANNKAQTALTPVDVNKLPVASEDRNKTPLAKTPKSAEQKQQQQDQSSPALLTPIPEEPSPKSSVKRTPLQSFIELSRSTDVSPQRLDEELCKVLESEMVDTTVTSPAFNEWLTKLGLKDAINTPVRLELKDLKSASLENDHLKKLLEKVKEVELEIAAEEAKSAAQLWDCLEQECGDLQDQNSKLREDLEAARNVGAENGEENKVLHRKMEGLYMNLKNTEEESKVLKKHVKELSKKLNTQVKSVAEVAGMTKTEITETIIDNIKRRVDSIMDERSQLEGQLKEALEVNKRQQLEQTQMREEYQTLQSEKVQVIERAASEQNQMMMRFEKLQLEKEEISRVAHEESNALKHKCDQLQKEKMEICEKAVQEQSQLQKKYEALEKEKQEACAKALEACEEILLEQEAMRDQNQRLQKENEESNGVVKEAYDQLSGMHDELKVSYNRLVQEREQICDNAMDEQKQIKEKYNNFLKEKDEAYKAALEERTRVQEKYERILKEKEESCQKAIEEGMEFKLLSETSLQKLEEKTQVLKEEEHKCTELRSIIEQEKQKKAREEGNKISKDVQTVDAGLVTGVATDSNTAEAESLDSDTAEGLQEESTSNVGLSLFPLDGSDDEEIKVELKFNELSSPLPTEPDCVVKSESPQRLNRIKKAKDDVFDVALLQTRFRKFKQRNSRSRSRFDYSGEFDISAEECRRRAAALGLRSSPILGKKYSRTK